MCELIKCDFLRRHQSCYGFKQSKFRGSSLYYRLYTALGWLLFFVVMPFFVMYRLLSGRQLASLWQRCGIFSPSYVWQHQGRIWFHAASVGEVQAAIALISALQQSGIRADIIVSTVTEQGQLAAIRQLGHAALCLYAPLDLPWAIKRFLRKLKPSVYICLETELWPNMLRLAQAGGIKTLLLNGRLSERAFLNYSKIRGFMGQVLQSFNSASAIQHIDRKRYIALGLDPAKIVVHGNAKYDLRVESLLTSDECQSQCYGASPRESVARQYQELLGLDSKQPIFLAGSTHTGEEAIVLNAFEALALTIPNLMLIIAPRHLTRLEQIMAEWQNRGLSFQTFTQAVASKITNHRIILVDRMGELAKLYAAATYVFCGGSLAARGGHNIMEPARWGVPPLYGPHMNDYTDARALLEGQEAGYTIHDAQELVDTVTYFHYHPDKYQQAGQRALAVASAQQGAAAKQAAMIAQALGCSTCVN